MDILQNLPNSLYDLTNNLDSTTQMMYGGLLTNIASNVYNSNSSTMNLMAVTVGSIAVTKIIKNMHEHTKFNKIFHCVEGTYLKLKQWLQLEYSSIIINDYSVSFKKYISYISQKYKNELVLDNMNRNTNEHIDLKELKFAKTLVDTYKKNNIIHIIVIDLSQKQDIVIKSKTLNVADLNLYVKNALINITNTNSLNIHTPVFNRENKKNKKNINNINNDENLQNNKNITTTINWIHENVVTNKKIENTIVSNLVTENFINDVEHFIKNEDYYNQKGIPYKRGYLLHGPPGTGKTSIIKAIANTFGFDVYCINMDEIKTSSDITSIFRGINSVNNYHIICFEDIDRSNIFTGDIGRDYYGFNQTNKIKNECLRTLLNELDGIVEGNKRIIIFTANDETKISAIDALCRPGRIDKKVEIGYCDFQQLNALYNHYTSTNEKLNIVSLTEKITPANAIKILLSDVSITAQQFLEKLNVNNINVDNDISNIDIENNNNANNLQDDIFTDLQTTRKIYTLKNLITKSSKKVKDITKAFKTSRTLPLNLKRKIDSVMVDYDKIDKTIKRFKFKGDQ